MDVKTEDRRLEKDSTKIPDTKKSKEKLISKNHRLVKRTTVQYPKRKKDIYVNNTTSFKAYLKICEKILDSDAKEVVIHGLGKAVSRACNLALRVQEIHYGTLELDIKTSAINLTDDLEPKTEDFNCEVNDRINPAIHIRVFRSALIGSLRFSALSETSNHSLVAA